MNKQQFETITKWQDKVFTQATALSCVNHLLEEVKELKDDIEAGKPVTAEVPDCFLLLFGICNKSGLNYDDVVRSIDEKMEVNYTRKWGSVNEHGYVKHIPTLEQKKELPEECINRTGDANFQCFETGKCKQCLH